MTTLPDTNTKQKMKIKTFEDACKKMQVSTELPVVDMLPEKHRKSIIAYYRLIIIVAAHNDGWEPNWDDHNEEKWFPWFDIEASEDEPSGSGFSGSGSYYGGSSTDVGSRLYFKTRELCDYAREQFADIYKDYLLISQ